MIKVNDLWFHYTTGKDVLKDISFAVQQGERLALLGHNGSGKTTLVKHLNGLLRPSRGALTICGKSTEDKKVAELAGMVALQFQNPDDQICKGTVWEEVTFGPRNLGYPEERMRTLVNASLDAFELLPMTQRNPHDLGLSERKRLSMASVMSMDTDIVVLDEPTAGLDPRELAMLAGALRRLESKGKTVLVISHDMDFIAENMTRAICLENGEIRFDGKIANLFADHSLMERCGLLPPQTAQLGARLDLNLHNFTPQGVVKALLAARHT